MIFIQHNVLRYTVRLLFARNPQTKMTGVIARFGEKSSEREDAPMQRTDKNCKQILNNSATGFVKM